MSTPCDTMLPRIGITMGDVNGIGPELIAKAFAGHAVRNKCRPVVFGSADALGAVAHLAPGIPELFPVETIASGCSLTSGIPVFHAEAAAPETRFGVLDPAAGASAVAWIEAAARACIAGELDAMVTCPINKECIYKAGCTFTGHTELVADLCGVSDYRMCLFAGAMRIVHLTGHLSLKDALACVTHDRIVRSIEIGWEAMTRMRLPLKRIGVAGLNPHAGEAGAFGREEIDDIAPAVAACRASGIDCRGPISPDTIFRMMRAGELDMVIAMYHDQGHIPLKLIAMDEGVNVTLGIPIVRTSVDHGTAFDIAGKGLAREASLIAAIELAVRLGSAA